MSDPEFDLDLGIEHHRRERFIDIPAQSAKTINTLLDQHLPLGVLWKCSQVRWIFDLDDLIFELCNDSPGGIDVVARSDVISRKRLDACRADLRMVASGMSSWSTYDFGVLLLQLAETAAGHVQDFRDSQRAKRKVRGQTGRGWDASKITDWSQILDNEHGVDLLTVNDTAEFVLGYSISEIVEQMPEEWRLVHVEPVFRADLVGRFLRRRRAMKEEMMEVNYTQLRECVSRRDIRAGKVEDSVEGISEYLATPHVTFHGAPMSVIASIVRYGFVIPGEEVGKSSLGKLEVRCGASFGVGVYSSPSLPFASMYASNARGQFDVRSPKDIPGLRILVCATLMGRSLQVSREETRRTTNLDRQGAHSHVSPCGNEFIVFDKAQIIPCYVLHIDFGALKAREQFAKLKNDPDRLERRRLKPRIQTGHASDSREPEAVRAKKVALKAAAAKWFPYGFGPATGSTFVIEDMAPVSDDEEEYGDFQALRQEQEFEIQEKLERGDDEKLSWFDTYQSARETYQTVRVEREVDAW